MEEKKQAKEALSMDYGIKISLIMIEAAWLLILLLNGKRASGGRRGSE